MNNVYYLPMVPEDPTSYYRATGVMEYINHPEIKVKNIFQRETYTWANLSGATTVIIQRPFSTGHVALIKMAKDMGIRVITDFDDDLLNVPVHNNTSITYEDQKKYTKMCINLSDEVWVSTMALKKSFEPFNSNIYVIPNAHNDFLFPVSEKQEYNKENKLATYRGGPSHEADVSQDVNYLVNIINGNPEWEFRFLGARFSLIENRTMKCENHTVTNPMTLIQFYKYLHESNPNIMFFPLLDNKFNHSKSNICFIEATYSGAAMFGMKNLPEFNYDFIIDYWALNEHLMDTDHNLLKGYNEEAWDYIQENLLLSKINNKRIERLLS